MPQATLALSLRKALQEPRWQRALKWAGLVVAGLSVAAFGYILYTQRATLLLLLQRADPAQLLPVVLWYTLDLLLYIVAWRLALQAFGVHVPLLEDIRIFVMANAARRLPGTLWYVGGRVALYSRLGVPTGTVLRASGLEAAMIWLSAALVALPSLAYRLAGGPVWTAAGAIAAAVLLHPTTLRALLSRFGRGAAAGLSLRLLYGLLLVHSAGWLLGGVLLHSVIAIFQPLPVNAIPPVIADWALAGAVSTLALFLPSNFGLTEITLTVLLSRIVPPSVAVLAAAGMRVLATLLDLISGGLVWAFLRAKRPH